MRESNVVHQECPECGCLEIVKDNERGEMICSRCGFVLVDYSLDKTPEWRAYTLEEKRNLPRAGSPLTYTMHDKGLSTEISKDGKDYSGRSMKSGVRYKFYRLRKWDRRSKYSGSSDRNLSQALSQIHLIGDKLNLPLSVLETASKLYRKALEEDLIKGHTIKGAAVSCIYMACRQCKIVRRLDEISEKSSIPVKELARMYRHLFWGLDIDVPRSDKGKIISKLVSALGLLGRTERTAVQILREAEGNMLTVGRGPAGMAAACIYISCNLNGEARTQRDVAYHAGITEVTLRNRYKELLEKLDFIITI
ncbi:MAG: transcription initiation factor IIB [Candidatus Bathyarchaeia archaeon]